MDVRLSHASDFINFFKSSLAFAKIYTIEIKIRIFMEQRKFAPFSSIPNNIDKTR